MKNCPHCATSLPDEDAFCRKCGARQDGSSAAPTAVAPAIATQSGGVEVTADQVAISGDVVGGDKTITAGGHVLINSTLIVYTGENPAVDQARLAKYLKHVSAICAPMKLVAIDQGAATPGATPLGLTSVYVDLNLDLKIPAQQTFAEYRQREQPSNGGQRSEGEPDGRETRVVPVLEALAQCSQLALLGKPGSGKSTLSAYLALSLAEAGLNVPGTLERLGATWTHGPLLPVRVILRQLAETLPADLKRGRAEHVWDFIQAEVNGYAIHDDLGALLRQVADQSGALFLLDGLDEAGDDQRRARAGSRDGIYEHGWRALSLPDHGAALRLGGCRTAYQAGAPRLPAGGFRV